MKGKPKASVAFDKVLSIRIDYKLVSCVSILIDTY